MYVCYSLLACFLVTQRLSAQASNFPERNGIKFSPRMDGNLIFLNNFDRELPPEMQKLYRLAEEKLADNKTESFSALADHPEFQEHCSAHGRTDDRQYYRFVG